MFKIYMIMYDGKVSSEVYKTEELAISHLERQGYIEISNWAYKLDDHIATIHEGSVKFE